ncbi:MAG: methyltransferase domain-containing protein [Bacteroidota bacterium]
MQSSNSLIKNQYYQPELFEDILKRLNENEVDINNVSRMDIAGVDEFHVRGAEVSYELVQEIYHNNAKVLDVGCALGGPSRMLADEYNCEVTGIDICNEYIRTAKKLSELVGLIDKTKFIQADALDLPFEDGSFDIVWTQHVQMNIQDKKKFYSEISRVLTDEGVLIYYDIFQKNKESIIYPVLWANNASLSFLETITVVNALLLELGFKKLQSTDQTYKAKQFLNNLFEKIKKYGPPKLGLNVLMGNSTKKKLGNILEGLENNKIELQSGIYRKKSFFETNNLSAKN